MANLSKKELSMKIQSQILLLGATSAFVWGGVSVAPSYAIKLIGNLPPDNDRATTLIAKNNGTTESVSFFGVLGKLY